MATSLSDLRAVRTRLRTRPRWLPRGAALPGAIFAVVVLAATAGPWVTMDASKQNLRNAKQGLFTPGHPLGTDAFGRDILARVVEGARVSLIVGFSAVTVCLLIGGGLGILAGYRRGAIDTIIMRLMDMILAFPTLVLALSIAAFLGPSLRNVVVAVAFSQLPEYARLGRATALSIRERDFVIGSRLMGARHRHVLGRHIMPNIVGPLTTYALLAVGVAIVVEASLSFLGLGVRPPTPSWGAMIAEGRADLELAPHIVLVPGVALFITVLSLNLLADAVRSRNTDTTGSVM